MAPNLTGFIVDVIHCYNISKWSMRLFFNQLFYFLLQLQSRERHILDCHPRNHVFSIDKVNPGNSVVGKQGKYLPVRIEVERHFKLVFFPELADNLCLFRPGDGHEPEIWVFLVQF